MNTSREAYTEGVLAGLGGNQVWENPHTGKDSNTQDFHSWFAGWCAGRKRREEATESVSAMALKLVKKEQAQDSQNIDKA